LVEGRIRGILIVAFDSILIVSYLTRCRIHNMEIARPMAKRKTNKSQAIRDYKMAHPEAGPTEISKALGNVPPAMVSNVLSKAGKSKRKVKRGRPKVSAGAAATPTTANSQSFRQVIVAVQLMQECGGDATAAKSAIDAASAVAKLLAK
jgi:hypothetical protein